ncbi:MAG: hypothetical protein ACK5P7_11535 [Bdellovibrio sp.]|jgi:uncharacterized membrane protein
MFTISDLFDKSWNAIKDQLALVAGLTLVYGVGLAAISMIPFAGSFLSAPFTAGYMVCLLKIRAKQDIDYNDVFWGFQNFNRFAQLLLAGFIVGILMILGFFFLVIPGIWFLVASSLTTAYLVLNDGDAITSMKKSLAAVQGNWWHVCGLLIVLGLLAFAGALCFFVGLLIAMPVATLMTLGAAEALSAKADPATSGPGTTAPSHGPSIITVNPS